MARNKRSVICITLCIMTILGVVLCGCDDLGAYDSTAEYYSSFGDVVLINGTTRESKSYSVDEYFYNEKSREDFLKGEDGVYTGVEHSDYVYMAIPFEKDIEMDTFALYLQSTENVTVYINAFVVDKIPTDWKGIADLDTDNEESNEESSEESSEETEKVYDDPDPATRVGETSLALRAGQWNSFSLDTFKINGTIGKSIYIEEDQYLLLQIRNNSGVRVFDENKQIYVDPQTGLELKPAKITMTNLLIRALSVETGTDLQEEEV